MTHIEGQGRVAHEERPSGHPWQDVLVGVGEPVQLLTGIAHRRLHLAAQSRRVSGREFKPG